MIIIEQTPTITAGAYSANDAVGGKLTFRGVPEDGLVHSATVYDKSGQKVSVDLVLFQEDFTATSDNAAFAITASEEASVISVINLTTYDDLGADAIAVAENLSIPYRLVDRDSKLFGQLVTRGTPTYTSTSDLIVKLAVLPYRG